MTVQMMGTNSALKYLSDHLADLVKQYNTTVDYVHQLEDRVAKLEEDKPKEPSQ